MWCPIPLPPVLEPVGDLRGGEFRPLGQLPLLIRSGIPVPCVALLQGVPAALLETVHRLLPVPDRLRKGILLAQAVFVHGPCDGNMKLLG